MSTHEVPIIALPKIEPHFNADKLGLIKIWGYTIVVDKTQWKEGDLAAYICPDTMVPLNRPEFSFLANDKNTFKEFERIKVKKLRGIYSQGLLIPAPEGSKVGDNAWEFLGVERYEPPIDLRTSGIQEKGPQCPKYDLENWHKYKDLLIEGEQVYLNEKLHGANARYTYTKDLETGEYRMYCGSRTNWKKKDETCVWWQALKQNPWIEEICRESLDYVFYGEIFGQVQDLKYGSKPGQIFFRIFDILNQDCQWAPIETLVGLSVLKPDWVPPTVYIGPYSEEKMRELAEGQSLIAGANHIREGIVIKTIENRYSDILGGRIALKYVSNKYLEKAK